MKITIKQLRHTIRKLLKEATEFDDDIYDMLEPMFGSMVYDAIESIEYDEMGGSILVTGYLAFVDTEQPSGMGETYPVFETPSEYNAQAWVQGLMDDLYISGHVQVTSFWYGGREGKLKDADGNETGGVGTGNGTVNVEITLDPEYFE